MRVAVVHDWLTVYAGAEKVLEQILKIVPDADLFSVVDFFPEHLRSHVLGKKATTTFIQKLPLSKRYYRAYLPLMPIAIEQLDLSPYDLVISSSYAVAKGVLTAPDQRHICYCHSPIRYAWDLQHQYLEGKKRPLARWLLHKIRLWDVRSAHGVDTFIANSDFIAKRIKKCYGREAETIYPPVAIHQFPVCEQKEDFYVTASRFVSYKKIDRIVEAFRKMPSRSLFVIGEGPEGRKLRANAPKNVTFLGHLSQEKMGEYFGRARAFIYAALEDFGIVPLEAQACGTPVIAYGKGGVKETCAESGLFFMEQSSAAIQEAVELFEKEKPPSPALCRENAERFSESHFREEFSKRIIK